MINAEEVNRLVSLRARDLAAAGGSVPSAERLAYLGMILGLSLTAPRASLNVQALETLPREGYRIEKIRYESQPGVWVSAHFYLPDLPGPLPILLRPVGEWLEKKASAVAQASAIGFALAGYGVLMIDAPGRGGEEGPNNSRAELGLRLDPRLAAGIPPLGVYAWDLIRALDYVESRPGVNASQIGIVGEGLGGQAAGLAFALDKRIRAATLVSSMASMELAAWPEVGVPGILKLGDWADILGLRAKDGAVFLIGAEEELPQRKDGNHKTDEKLRRIFREAGRSAEYRCETFPFGYDFNRRMREATVAFLHQHLKGEAMKPYVPELRPLTDGVQNPTPAGTISPHELAEEALEGTTFTGLLAQPIAESELVPFDALSRLVSWSRYGRLKEIFPGSILALHDENLAPTEPGSIAIPVRPVAFDPLVLIGLSWYEVIAQWLHFCLPGGPTAWEEHGLRGDGFTSLVATMRTLVNQTPSGPPPRMCVALGSVSSHVATVLQRLRPDLTLELSESPVGWQAGFESSDPALIMPGGRFLRF